jgi:hypothetical protein
VIKSPTCPVCGKPVEQSTDSRAFPFCSDRCRKVDFFRWWDGRYAVVEDLAPQTPDQTPGTPAPPIDPDLADID